jgi:hypothetical protein
MSFFRLITASASESALLATVHFHELMATNNDADTQSGVETMAPTDYDHIVARADAFNDDRLAIQPLAIGHLGLLTDQHNLIIRQIGCHRSIVRLLPLRNGRA